MGSVSFREFIRWVPDEASEPTSTLVVTSPERRFVDLRILLTSDENNGIEDHEVLPLDRLDWGIAGTTSSSTREDASGNKISHSKFQHWVSSRTTNPENEVDEGDMYPRADGKTLEKGAMVNPATGQLTDYEELWLDLDPSPINGSSKVRCVVLEWEDGKGGRGRVVRLGQFVQSFLRVGDEMAAERWEWKQQGGWKRTVKIGNIELPCSKTLSDEDNFAVGDEFGFEGKSWRVVEVLL